MPLKNTKLNKIKLKRFNILSLKLKKAGAKNPYKKMTEEAETNEAENNNVHIKLTESLEAENGKEIQNLYTNNQNRRRRS